MQAYIRRDTRYGRGWGLAVIKDVAGCDDPLFYTVQRQTDGKYLTPDGHWHSKRERLRAEGYQLENDTLRMSMEPVLLHGLDDRTPYRMALSGTQSFPLTLSRDLAHELAALGFVPGKDEKQRAQAPAQTRYSITALCTGLVLCLALAIYWHTDHIMHMSSGEPIIYSEDPDDAPGQVTFVHAGPMAAMDFDFETYDQSGLNGAALGSLPAMDSESPPPSSYTHIMAGLDRRAGALEQAGVDALLPQQAPPLSPVAVVPDIEGLGDDAVEEHMQDLLRSAEQGSTEAMFTLAQLYDPLCNGENRSFSNPLLAREWYHRAEACGLATATTAMENLFNWLLLQAGSGSDKAAFAISFW